MTGWTLFYQLLLVLTPLAPLLLGGLFWTQVEREKIVRLAAWVAVPGLLLAILPEGDIQTRVDWLLLGGRLGLDAVGRVFLLLTALLWTAAALHLRRTLAGDAHTRRFMVFFLLAMSGNLGLTLSLDLLGFYLFFALMSFSSYALVVHDGRDFSRRAGRVYVTLVLLGEVLLFAGLVMLARHTPFLLLSEAATALANSAHSHLILAILIAALGIKIGMVPLHFWLPLAHPAAPVPASAVLSGAMIKAGVLGLARLLPLGQVQLPVWSGALIAMGVVMAFYGVVVGLPQRDMKTVLAYSSISQMGFVVIALALGLAQPDAWPLLAPVVAFYALHHGLAKGGLFLGVAMAPALAGRGPLRWLAWAGLLWPALALSGAPWTSGALAKGALKPFLKGAPGGWPQLLPGLLSLAAVGTALIMARFLLLLRQQREAQSAPPSVAMWCGFLLLLLASLACAGGWLADLATARTTLSPSVSFFSALWPPVLAALMVFLWLQTPLPRWSSNLPAAPGDLVVPLEKALRYMRERGRSLLARVRIEPSRRVRLLRGRWWHRLAVQEVLRETEQALRRFPVAGVLFAFLLLLFLLL